MYFIYIYILDMNYEEVDLDNLHQREHSKTMKIEDPVSGLKTSSLNRTLTRSSSIVAQDQGDEETCYAYVSATLITRYITQKTPDKFKMNDDEANALYDGKQEENCVFYNSSDIIKVRDILSRNKCSNKKRYYHMLLFYNLLFKIKNDYGCDSGNVNNVLWKFFNTSLFFTGKNNIIVSPKIDKLVFNELLLPIYSFYTKDSVVEEYYDLNQNNPQRNWILNFPEGAKRALENKMYVAFSFSMPKNQWATINMTNIFDSNPVINDTSCIHPISRHAVVITKWEQESPGMPAYITILNSWGPDWGTNGFIRISSENYYKFVMTPFCKKDFDINGTEDTVPEGEEYYGMSFTYIEVADDKPYVTEPVLTQKNNFLSRVMSKMPSLSKGGKTKKSKKRKSKKSRKSIKSKKSRKNKSKKRA